MKREGVSVKIQPGEGHFELLTHATSAAVVTEMMNFALQMMSFARQLWDPYLFSGGWAAARGRRGAGCGVPAAIEWAAFNAPSISKCTVRPPQPHATAEIPALDLVDQFRSACSDVFLYQSGGRN